MSLVQLDYHDLFAFVDIVIVSTFQLLMRHIQIPAVQPGILAPHPNICILSGHLPQHIKISELVRRVLHANFAKNH